MKIRISNRSRSRGVALIIVMLFITVLGILAGGFAYSMKIENKLARNANAEPEFDWLGRSGIELARYVVGQQMNIQTEPYDALNQKWAGGPMGTNEIFANISLDNNQLGNGTFSLKIIDLERYYNINVSDEIALRQAFTLVGVDTADIPQLINAILDWRDPDEFEMPNGAESDYYQSLKPPFGPYTAKNGPIDDLTELLLIKGITPEMYYRGAGGGPAGGFSVADRLRGQVAYTNALEDIFTPLSARFVNINTASELVLQMFPGLDGQIAHGIIAARAGPDGVDGTEDDVPFKTPGELINVPGFTQAGARGAQQFFRVRSATFRVEVNMEVDGSHRTMVGLLYRTAPNDVRVLSTYWQ
jgi:hypothetical protein